MWPLPEMGLGNLLFLWCWAYAGPGGLGFVTNDPRPRLVLRTPRAKHWEDLTPAIHRFLIDRSRVHWLDERGAFWNDWFAETGDVRGFTDASRAGFIREVLLTSPLLAGVGASPLGDPSTMVVNVRRGDYYSDPVNRGIFGMDLVNYVDQAVMRAIDDQGPVKRIHVVSDDPAWCRHRLGFLADYADEVTEPPPGATPEGNFRDVCSARRLVLTNSTFSMWAGYISSLLHADNASSIWAPAFYEARMTAGRCFRYDPGWSFIDELPPRRGEATGWAAWQPEGLMSDEDPDLPPLRS